MRCALVPKLERLDERRELPFVGTWMFSVELKQAHKVNNALSLFRG
jgi:hypothetical protein